MEKSSLTSLQEAESLNDKGKEAARKGDTEAAVDLYSQAIDLLSELSLDDKKLEAEICINRSTAYMHMKEHRLSLMDAMHTIEARQTWYKGFLQCSKILEAEKQYAGSLEMHWNALQHALGAYSLEETEENGTEVEDTMVSLCGLVARVKDKDVQIARQTFYKIVTFHSTSVVPFREVLATRDRYDIMLSFLQLDLDAAMSEKLKKTITLEFFNNQWNPGQEEACIVGIQTGILKKEDFYFDTCNTLLHYAVFRSCTTGFGTKLLAYLLREHYTTEEQVRDRNVQGLTILHTLVGSAGLSHKLLPEALAALECLMSFDHVDLAMKDTYGRSVTDTGLSGYMPFVCAVIAAEQHRRENAAKMSLPGVSSHGPSASQRRGYSQTSKTRGSQKRGSRANKKGQQEKQDVSKGGKLEKVTSLKAQGEESMQNGDTEASIRFYTQAVDLMRDLASVDHKLKAEIRCNRSAVYTITRRYQEAVQDANCAITAAPQWYKGYLQLSRTYELQEQYGKSLHMHHRALMKASQACIDNLTADNEATLMETLVSQCILISLVKEKDEHMAMKCFQLAVESFGLTEVVFKHVADSKRYDVLLPLLTFKFDRSTKRSLKQTILYNYMFVDDYTDTHEAACISGVQQGLLTMQDMCYRGSPAPLHYAVVLSTKSGSTRLLEYLLQDHFTSKEKVEVYDVTGLTIMHNLFYVSETYQRKTGATKTLTCLMSFDYVDPLMKDKFGNSVLDLPKVGEISDLRDLVIQAAGKRKNGDSETCTLQKKDSETDKGVRTPEDAADETSQQDDLRRVNEQLKEDILNVKTKIKDIEKQHKEEDHESSATDEDRVIKCTICDSDVTVETNLSKLPGVLAKLGAIQL